MKQAIKNGSIVDHPLYTYSLWLFNKYVEALSFGSSETMRSSDHAAFIRDALEKHCRNLETVKIPHVRKWTKGLLSDIAKSRSNPKEIKLSYSGKDALHFEEAEQRRREIRCQKWEHDRDQYIGKPALQTEAKAVRTMVKMINMSRQFADLEMNSMDDAHLCGAVNMLLKAIERNGYEIDPDYTDKIIIRNRKDHERSGR